MNSVPKWMAKVDSICSTHVAEELRRWIEPGKMFWNELAMNRFYKDQGFVDHSDIQSRDWESGEKRFFWTSCDLPSQ